MAKIIFTARYVKSISKGQMKNYVKYIATRPNAESYAQPISDEVSALQREWIAKELKKTPKLKEECAAEYQAYEENTSCQTAEDLIHKIAEVQIYHGNDMKNYVGYLAKRPRAEFTEQGHALWNNEDEKIDLRKVQKEAAEYQGRIWNFVVSLKREDAQRLGYDNAKVWRNLVTQKSLTMAKEMRIKPENLVWYGAFHNESYHPHVHLVMFSKSQKAFITKDCLENLKMSLSRQVFADDRIEIYKEQNKIRSQMSETVKDKIDLLISSINNGNFQNDNIEKTLIELSESLENYKGKTVYGYLPQPMKKKINYIIDELEKDENISELYNLWCKYNDKIIEMYQQTKAEYIPLSQNKTFKPLKNIIIREALNICYGEISFNDIEDEDDEPINDEYTGKSFYENHPGLYEYQMAKMCLNTNSESYDVVLGIKYLKESADLGYEFAIYKLGKFYLDGEYVKKDLHKAEELLTKASDINNCYAQYRLAKLYLNNNSDLFDSVKGLDYLLKSASNGYKYALYQLGKIYYNGVFVEKDINKAIQYLMAAAEKDCEYAENLFEYINNNSKEWQSYIAILAVLNDLSKLFKKEFDNKYKLTPHTDRKTLQKINEKKQAMGLK